MSTIRNLVLYLLIILFNMSEDFLFRTYIYFYCILINTHPVTSYNLSKFVSCESKKDNA